MLSRQLVLVVIGITGCAPEPLPPEVDPRVMVLPPGAAMAVSADRIQVATDAVAEDGRPLASVIPGDVLVSGEGHGFVRKVVEVHPGAQLELVTVDGSLSDALIAGHGESRMAAPASEGKADGIDGRFNLGGKSISASGVHLAVHDGFVGFAPDVDVDFDLEDRGLAYFEAIASGHLEARLDAELWTDSAVNLRRNQPLWTSPSKVFVQFIGWVPVIEVLQLELGISLTVETGGPVHARLGGAFEGELSAGLRYDGSWAPVAERQLVFHPLNGIDSDGIGSIKIGPYAQVSLRFYGLVGPYMRVVPFLGIRRSETGWQPGFGLLGTVGGDLSLGSFPAIGLGFDLFDVWRDL